MEPQFFLWRHWLKINGISTTTGYRLVKDGSIKLIKIRRVIETSLVKAMLDGNDQAQKKVDQAVLSRKAAAWRYEKEWRLIGPRGQGNCPLELEEIVFGMRCAETVKYAVVKALIGRTRPVKFYDIRESRGSFLLKKYSLDGGITTASPSY